MGLHARARRFLGKNGTLKKPKTLIKKTDNTSTIKWIPGDGHPQWTICTSVADHVW